LTGKLKVERAKNEEEKRVVVDVVHQSLRKIHRVSLVRTLARGAIDDFTANREAALGEG